eukprot:scaffold703_cov245-Pinguiococcus_pyrenoidosus.AAC.15
MKDEDEDEPEIAVLHELGEDTDEILVIARPLRYVVRLPRQLLEGEAGDPPRTQGEPPQRKLPPCPAILVHEDLDVGRPHNEGDDRRAILPQRRDVAVRIGISRMEQAERQVADDETLQNRLEDPAPKEEGVEVLVVDTGRVERRDADGARVLHVPVPDAEQEHRHTGEEDVVQLHRGFNEILLPAHEVPKSHPKVGHREQEVLVEYVQHRLRHSAIVVAPLDHEKPPQELELRDGVVGVVHSLHPFLPADPHPDVRPLDHRHVVRAVADGEALDVRVPVLHHLHNLLLLLGADSARHHRVA